MAKTEKSTKDIYSNRAEINLKEFMLLDSQAQDKKIKDTLEIDMYENTIKVENKHIEKVLNIAFDNRDNEIYLPDNLRVQKEGSKLLFSFKKRKTGLIIFLFAFAFLGVVGFSSYAGIQYLARMELNIDLDGDGIPDLNLDLNNDTICNVNCDTNKDKKPDVNIDYHSNRRAIFNKLIERDGKKYYLNGINQDTNNDGKCDINCDTNNDGWPDLNIDYDGDGIVDLDRDIDGDGIKDLDLDVNGDGVCDLNCDENKDNMCDHKCANIDVKNNGNGTSSSNGNSRVDFTAADLIVTFEGDSVVNASMIFPDDQNDPELNTEVPDLKFTIENTTDKTLYYDMDWINVENTYETDNFWYKVSSDNNGLTKDWGRTPKKDIRFGSRVSIAPKTIQSYTISFTLHGTGEEQNIDQGKIYKGQVRVEMIEILR